MTEPALSDQIAKVFGYLRGLHATHFLDVGLRLGLFRALAQAARSTAELALVSRLHEPYVRSFCEMGFHLEVLDREGDTYRLAPQMERLLGDPEDTFFLGGFPRVHLSLSRDYERYPELFRSGGMHPYQAHDREFLEGVAGATRALPRMFLDMLAPRMPSLIVKMMQGGRVLDVGCGAGHALITFAERFPRCRGVGIEIEPVSAAMAREQIRSRGLDGRLQVYEGWDIPGGHEEAFDLVTQFLVLHEIRPELKQEVLDRCAAALVPGGLLVLFDECRPEDETTVRHPILGFSVVAQWFELTWGNVINTRREILQMIERAGLERGEDVELSRFRIFTALKPLPEAA